MNENLSVLEKEVWDGVGGTWERRTLEESGKEIVKNTCKGSFCELENTLYKTWMQLEKRIRRNLKRNRKKHKRKSVFPFKILLGFCLVPLKVLPGFFQFFLAFLSVSLLGT